MPLYSRDGCVDHFTGLCMWPDYELRGTWLSVPLTRQEGLLMLTLLSHREVSMELITEIIWPGAWPDSWRDCAKGLMMRLRDKLRWYDCEINNRRRFGYSINYLGSEVSEPDVVGSLEFNPT